MSTLQFVSSQTGEDLLQGSNKEIRQILCSVNDLQNGQMKEFEVKTAGVDTSVLLIKQNNKFYAYSSKCCHYKLPLTKGLL